MSRTALLGAAGAIALALVSYAAFEVGVQRGRVEAAGGPSPTLPAVSVSSASKPIDPSLLKAGDIDPATGRRVLYWHDPMVPGHKFDKPGKSPFMDMELVPVYADETAGSGGVAIEPRLQQNLGVRTSKVVSGSLSNAITAVGNVAYNERDVAVVQARSSGFVEKLLVRATLDRVRKGQPLAVLYVPDWIAAQEEYLTAKRLRRSVDAMALGGLADAAAQRMRLAGMSEEQIQTIDRGDAVQPRLTITSPIDGVVGELAAREGMTVAPGAPLFRLNGLATVWVNAEVPEAAAAEVRPGSLVEARTPAFPGSVFKGHVNAILPEVSAATRTLKARIELANPGARLVPGMFATVNLAPMKRSDVMLVPTEALIQTGTRAIVIVAQGDGRFQPVDVEPGLEANGQTQIRKGLHVGDTVVVSGQFLIDSEANLRAAITRMSAPPPVASSAPSPAMGGTEMNGAPGVNAGKAQHHHHE